MNANATYTDIETALENKLGAAATDAMMEALIGEGQLRDFTKAPLATVVEVMTGEKPKSRATKDDLVAAIHAAQERIAKAVREYESQDLKSAIDDLAANVPAPLPPASDSLLDAMLDDAIGQDAEDLHDATNTEPAQAAATAATVQAGVAVDNGDGTYTVDGCTYLNPADAAEMNPVFADITAEARKHGAVNPVLDAIEAAQANGVPAAIVEHIAKDAVEDSKPKPTAKPKARKTGATFCNSWFGTSDKVTLVDGKVASCTAHDGEQVLLPEAPATLTLEDAQDLHEAVTGRPCRRKVQGDVIYRINSYLRGKDARPAREPSKASKVRQLVKDLAALAEGHNDDKASHYCSVTVDALIDRARALDL